MPLILLSFCMLITPLLFFVTFTSALLGVVGVACTTAGRAEAGVTADRVVAPLGTQTVVVVQQAFVNIYIRLVYVDEKGRR